MAITEHSWLDGLSDEDKAFIKRFVLASGSLKAVAGEYGISYPTVRLRLDRLIAKIEILDDQTVTDEFDRTARALHAGGRIDVQTLKSLLKAHRDSMKEADHESD